MTSLQYSIPVFHRAWYLLPLTRTSGVTASMVIENTILCFVVATLAANSSLYQSLSDIGFAEGTCK